jgi:phospholipase/carboxylesterase
MRPGLLARRAEIRKDPEMLTRPRLALALLVTLTAGCRSRPEAPPPAAPPAPLTYVEQHLGGDPADPRLPLIVAIHGLGDRPEAFAGAFEGLRLPARLILPRAPIHWGNGGFAWFRTRTREARPALLALEIAGAAEQLSTLLADLQARYPQAGPPVVTGFSQGGMLTLALAVRHPEQLAAAVPMAGWLPPPLLPVARPPRPLAIRALHGRADRVVPFGPAEASIRALAELGWDAQLIPFEGVDHQLPPAMQATLFELLAKAVAAQATRTATVAR